MMNNDQCSIWYFQDSLDSELPGKRGRGWKPSQGSYLGSHHLLSSTSLKYISPVTTQVSTGLLAWCPPPPPATCTTRRARPTSTRPPTTRPPTSIRTNSTSAGHLLHIILMVGRIRTPDGQQFKMDVIAQVAQNCMKKLGNIFAPKKTDDMSFPHNWQ